MAKGLNRLGNVYKPRICLGTRLGTPFYQSYKHFNVYSKCFKVFYQIEILKTLVGKCLHCLSSLGTNIISFIRLWSYKHKLSKLSHFLSFTTLKIQDPLLKTSMIWHFN